MADKMEFDEDLLFSEFEAVAQRTADFSSYQEAPVEISPSMDLKALQDENNRLKNLIKKLLVPDSRKHVNTKEKPLCHAVFFNNKISTEGRQKLEFFLQSLSAVNPDFVNGQESSEESESISLSSLQPSLSTLNDFVLCCESETSSEDSEELSRHYAVLNCAQYFDFYCIDACGLPIVHYTTGCNEGWEIPLYEQVFFTAVPCDSDGSLKVKVKRKKACFNCGNVGHNLSDCPEPQNRARIDSMRQQFVKKFSSPFAKDARYHVDEKRFGGFKPGVISSDLREALGLRSDELPPYIYKMRKLGYPPGYIPSASNSTLLLYNANGEVEDYVMEDIDEEDDGKTKESAFIEYPGFNCPLPKGVKDRSRELRYPPMSPHQSINEMDRWHNHRLQQMANSSGRRAEKNTNKRSRSETYDDTIDMDLDEQDQGSSGGILPQDAIETGRKRRKHDESDTTDEGGYSPTHPNIQYGTKEKRLLDQIHQISSSKPYNPSSNSSRSQPPIPCELTETKCEAETSLKTSKKERASSSLSLEEGEILSDEENTVEPKTPDEQEELEEEETKVNQGWWLDVPLIPANRKQKPLSPPPIPAVKLPMDLLTRFYTTSTVLQKVSFEDRIMWLDPIYGNIQVSSGRYDRLKEILQQKKLSKKGRKR